MTLKLVSNERAAELRIILKKKLAELEGQKTLSSNPKAEFDPEMMQAGILLSGYHIESGVRTFTAYAKTMLGDIGEATKPYLKSWYLSIKFDPCAVGFDGMDSSASVDNMDVNSAFKHSNEAQTTEDSFKERFPDKPWLLAGLSRGGSFEKFGTSAASEKSNGTDNKIFTEKAYLIAKAKLKSKLKHITESTPEKMAEIHEDIKSLANPTLELLANGKTDWYLNGGYYHSSKGPVIFLSDNDIDSMLSSESLEMYAKELEVPGIEKSVIYSSKLGVSDIGMSDGDLVRLAKSGNGKIIDRIDRRDSYWYAYVRDLITGIATEMKRLGNRKFLVVCNISHTDYDGLMTCTYLIQSLDVLVDAVNYAKVAASALLEIQKSKFYSFHGDELIATEPAGITNLREPNIHTLQVLFEQKYSLNYDPNKMYNSGRYYWSVIGPTKENVICRDLFKISSFLCEELSSYLASVGAAVRLGQPLPNPFNDFSQ